MSVFQDTRNGRISLECLTCLIRDVLTAQLGTYRARGLPHGIRDQSLINTLLNIQRFYWLASVESNCMSWFI